MGKIELIKDLEYNRKNLVIDEEKNILDGDNVVYTKVELIKNVYHADELVTMNQETIQIVEDIKNSFIETFKDRGGATKEQILFAEETAKVIFGELKEKCITGISAPCGFGKSSITLEILKKLIDIYKNTEDTDGIVIVTDRLESLRNTENCLDEMNLGGYTSILEGWNEEVCINKKI